MSQNLVGLPPKNVGPKMYSIRLDFAQLQTSIANISGVDKNIQHRKKRIDSNSSRVDKKYSELWSTNNKVGDVSLDPPKSTFSEDHISAPRRRSRLKFLHALQNDQGLLAHTPPRTGVSTSDFDREYLRNE